LTTWWTGKGYAGQGGTYLNFGGIIEALIRPPASEAMALSIAIKTGMYDATWTGVDLATATARATKLTTSLAKAHVVNTTGGWGNDWQTAAWAAYAGLAGWLLFPSLCARWWSTRPTASTATWCPTTATTRAP
jgi:hypothetical protein